MVYTETDHCTLFIAATATVLLPLYTILLFALTAHVTYSYVLDNLTCVVCLFCVLTTDLNYLNVVNVNKVSYEVNCGQWKQFDCLLSSLVMCSLTMRYYLTAFKVKDVLLQRIQYCDSFPKFESGTWVRQKLQVTWPIKCHLRVLYSVWNLNWQVTNGNIMEISNMERAK